MHTCALIHPQTLTPPSSAFFFPSHPLRGIYGDVKAVIGQVSGVELSDNRLVTEAARE